MAIPNSFAVVEVTIPSGASQPTAALQPGQSIYGGVILAIQMPALWDAADLTLTASTDDGTYDDVYDDAGGEMTIAADAGRYITLDPSKTAGLPYVKFRSGTSGTPVNQSADRVLKVVLGPVL